MYCELTLYDVPCGELVLPVRDKEEAEKIIAVVHEILLGTDYLSRYQYREQWGISQDVSPLRTMHGVTIDGIRPGGRPSV